MRKFFALILSLICLSSVAQSRIIEVYPRQFTSIELKGNVRATITIADSAASKIMLYGLTEKQINWKVKNGTLFVTIPSGVWDKGYAEVVISQPVISKIISSGAEIESVTPIVGSSFAIETDGSVNLIKLEVDVQNLDVTVGGQSDVAIKGKAVSSNLTATLGSRIDCLNCLADTIKAKSIGNSEIYVNPVGLLSAKANMGGTIYYAGDAALQLKTHTFGAIVPIYYGKEAPSRFKKAAADTVVDTAAVEATKIEPAKVVEPAKTVEPQAVVKPQAVAKPEKIKVEKPVKAEKVKKPKKEAHKTEQPVVKDDVGDFF